MPDVYIVTLGCPKNTVASRRLERGLSLLDVGVVDDPEAATAIIVNTCGFIDAAKEESIDVLLELGKRRSNNSGPKIIAIGCLAERYGQELSKAIPEVDCFLSFDELRSLPKILQVEGDINLDLQTHRGAATAYLEISDGCNNKCSFCAIPGIRGPYRSRPAEHIVAEAGYLAENGCKELIVIGQDTGVYGYDLLPKTNLPALLGRLAAVRGIGWIRLMYLQPQYASAELISVMAAETKICAYLDLPFQHADPKIIKAMKRWGDERVYLKIIDDIRQKIPDIALRTSVIVGFPGETKTELARLAHFLRRAELDYVGVFEFSAEEGTPAANYAGQLSERTKRSRSEQIRSLADEISDRRLSRFIDRALDVLVESGSDNYFVGRNEFQAPEIDGEVIISGAGLKPGDMTSVKIEAHSDYDLVGRLDHG
ncbi:MAG: 30S ribosomal protein S12 methylthiotransferase RimO [Actinomycetota bacterium]|nr:30S ribosomal protein S12 methylthiotransferase RimO [Actinomycetota bacterium]